MSQNMQHPPEERKSARMLVVLQSGEQRLITFTLPKESCTVQELLKQVGVQFEPDVTIQCIPSPSVNIDYLVTVGGNWNGKPETSLQLIPSKSQQQQQASLQQQQSTQQLTQCSPDQKLQTMQKINAVPVPQTIRARRNAVFYHKRNQTDPPPRYIPGMT